jgi:Fe-S cluster assembly protein SufD
MTQAVKPTDGKFAAFTPPFGNMGIRLYSTWKNCRIAFACCHVQHQNRCFFGHVLTVVEENAEATMQVDYASADADEQSSYIGATELVVGDAARLRYVALQDWNRSTYEFSHQRSVVGKDGNLDWVIGTMATRLTKASSKLTSKAWVPMLAFLVSSSPIKTNSSTLIPNKITMHL